MGNASEHDAAGAGREQARGRVRAVLAGMGVPADEIERAERDDVLDLLVADHLLVPADRRFTEQDVAAGSGMPVELARKFWRALGFPDVAPDDRVFTELDVEALVILQGLMALGAADVDSALQLARVIGSSMARIAEAEVSPALSGGTIGPLALGDSVEAADRLARLSDQALPAMAKLLEFAWRRHVQAATRRAMILRTRLSGALPQLCVGFADMVGFTVLSQQLPDDVLAAVVSRFEELAHDTVTSQGGRLVKMIGDEAMFVTEAALPAARIALALSETYADDELLSDVRVGLAVGPVLLQDGDYYGPVVNLAHRVVSMADPGAVLLSDHFHDELIEELRAAGPDAESSAAHEFRFKAVRPRQVKDVGRVQLWALHRPGAAPRSFEHRIARRWERLAELVREMEDYRNLGRTWLEDHLPEPAAGDEEGAHVTGGDGDVEGRA